MLKVSPWGLILFWLGTIFVGLSWDMSVSTRIAIFFIMGLVLFLMLAFDISKFMCVLKKEREQGIPFYFWRHVGTLDIICMFLLGYFILGSILTGF